MRILIPLLICCSAIAVIAWKQENTTTQNKQIALRWLEALNRQDTNAIVVFYSDSVLLESPNWEGIKKGKAEAVDVYRRYFSGTPALHHELMHLVSTEESVVIEYTSEGVFEHPEPNTPAYMKGKHYLLKNCTRLDILHHKIIRQVNYFDQVSFLRQVGFFDQK
jgi:steroid delta-isomerase-like uncharacterized protein